MNVQRTGPAAFRVVFESEQELRDEHRVNLSFGALRLRTTESVAMDTVLNVTLCGPGGEEMEVQARAVAALPDGMALAFDGDPDEILARLLPPPADAAPEEEPPPEKTQNTWDRVRALSQMEKILLAVKADRTERSLLLQDNDPRVLLSVLRNPRLTVEEVVRLAKSSTASQRDSCGHRSYGKRSAEQPQPGKRSTISRHIEAFVRRRLFLLKARSRS